jgi:hypothetical protein
MFAFTAWAIALCRFGPERVGFVAFPWPAPERVARRPDWGTEGVEATSRGEVVQRPATLVAQVAYLAP